MNSQRRGGFASILSILLVGVAGCGDESGQAPVVDAQLETLEDAPPPTDTARDDASSTDLGLDDGSSTETGASDGASSEAAVDDARADDATGDVVDGAAASDTMDTDATDATDATDVWTCGSASECPGVDGECAKRACTGGACSIVFTAKGTALAAQTAGDCQTLQCDGAGGVASVLDAADVSDDGNECTDDVCVGASPSHPAKASGVACGAAGGKLCNGAGACVECLTAATCPGADDECKTRTCVAFSCGVSYAPVTKASASQVAGDCKKVRCDGAGALETVNDDADVKDDGNPCTADACAAGTPTHTPVASGTTCGVGKVCDAAGACVTCLVDADCPASTSECKVARCTAGACGFAPKPLGTVTTAQTPGDCQQNQCDGAGSVTAVAADADKPVDGNPCTDDVCTAGVPSNPLRAEGSSCTGGVCSAGGACVQCVVASDCPGVDGECAKRTCVANACGTAFTAAGTALASQTAGDCKQKQCDGAGGVVLASDATDLPVDGLECTDDVCTAGTPSNPSKAAGAACSTGVCSGTACVQCLTASDCPGADTECATRTCTSNTCGFAYAPVGTPLSAQTAGDCQEKQCGTAGAIVSVAADADVPIDGLECTSDVCTAGVPSNPSTKEGSLCSSSGGQICNGAGACKPASLWLLRVGDGSAALGSGATAGFVDRRKFDVATYAVGADATIPLPTTTSGAQSLITFSGSAANDGNLTRSADGRFLSLGGYGAAVGTATVASTATTTVPRVIARLDAAGTVDTSTTITAFSGANLRAAVSSDGAQFWLSGSTTPRYVTFGAVADPTVTLAAAPTNARAIHLWGGQLFVSAAALTVSTVGSGAPTAGLVTSTGLTGLPASATSPGGFALFDRDPAVPGLDTLYLADDRATTSSGGVQKWTLGVGGTWTLATTFVATGVTNGFRALAAMEIGTKVYVVATSSETAPKVVLWIDDGLTSPASTLLATSATNTAWRGVAFGPR